MRANKFIALATGLSRRQADALLETGAITVNGARATAGYQLTPEDVVVYQGNRLAVQPTQTVMLHKPAGYVVSRDGQGSPTIYELLPHELRHLKPAGRLDKDSSGLLLLTNDGELANRLTHPKFEHEKVYEVELDTVLAAADRSAIEQGIQIEDYVSQLQLAGKDTTWRVTMHQGRNRQIRKTFADRGRTVVRLHRIQFGDYRLGKLSIGHWSVVN